MSKNSDDGASFPVWMEATCELATESPPRIAKSSAPKWECGSGRRDRQTGLKTKKTLDNRARCSTPRNR